MAPILTTPMAPEAALEGAAARAATGLTAWVAVHGRLAARPILGLTPPVGDRRAWVESDGTAWLGLGEARRWEATDPDSALALPDACRVALADAVFGAPAARAVTRCFGGLAFDPAAPATPWGTPGPLGRFVLPTWLVRQSADGEAEAVVLVEARAGEPAGALAERTATAWAELANWVAQAPEAPSVWLPARPAPDAESRLAWEAAVTSALESIRAGEVIKVALARSLPFEADRPIPAGPLFAALAAGAPHTHRFLIEDESGAFLGASPERLFRLEGAALAVDGLAGTAPRGQDPDSDTELGLGLLASVKDRHEQAVVVDWIAAALNPLAEAIDMPETPVLKRLPTVQHLHTPIVATLRPDTNLESVLAALHPTPAVGGAPRGRAIELIRTLEPGGRGWYAGPVGWVGLEAAEFAVAIRSAYLQGNRAAVMAGAGIVDGSVPALEWAETARKAAPLVRLLTGEVGS